MGSPVRILQLSDPHLRSGAEDRYRGRQPLGLLRHGLLTALGQLVASGTRPDLLLLSGDLCQDESWGGYVLLRDLLDGLPADLCPRAVALLAGNHDHDHLLRIAMGRRAVIAPALLRLGGWDVLLLDSHRPGSTAGWLGPAQLAWLQGVLAVGQVPLLVAVHHPPVPIGDGEMDAIGLRDAGALLPLLQRCPRLGGLVFGHVHQHWQGVLPGRAAVPLLGCPSTLCGFGPVQSCPLGRADDPGGRLLELSTGGEIRHRLLRWSIPAPPSLL